MCKRTERLSPRSYRCAMKQFLPCQPMCIAPTSIRYRLFQAISRWAVGSLHHNSKIETIIARALQYSVGHFIDCNPVTRRLLASLIDSSDAARQAESNEHEHSQTQIRISRTPSQGRRDAVWGSNRIRHH